MIASERYEDAIQVSIVMLQRLAHVLEYACDASLTHAQHTGLTHYAHYLAVEAQNELTSARLHARAAGLPPSVADSHRNAPTQDELPF
jgi:hypothetical protein